MAMIIWGVREVVDSTAMADALGDDASPTGQSSIKLASRLDCSPPTANEPEAMKTAQK